MSGCKCEPPCTFREVPLDEIEVGWDGPALGKKAQAFPKRKAIFIDRAFWRSIPTVVGRAGLLAHERGHIEGARCEPCADRRGGEILKREGWPTARDAQVAALAKLENRSPAAAADALGEGFGADGFLQHRERADGVVDELQAFLDVVAAGGVQYGGRTWSAMVGVDGGVRTDARQFELYQKGRAPKPGTDASDPKNWVVVDPGQVVTNAWSSKNGKHGKREAVDLWIVGVDGQPLLYPKDWQRAGLAKREDFDGVYAALGKLGKDMGLKWGGDFKSLIDRPHFETQSVTSRLLAFLALDVGGDDEPPSAPPLVDAGDGNAGGPALAIAALALLLFLAV